MLLSSSSNDYSMSTVSTSTANQPASRVRIRTLHVCEPSFPSRDVVRQENYARRQAQKQQGWCCPPGVPYQGIDPVHLPPKPTKLPSVRIPFHPSISIGTFFNPVRTNGPRLQRLEKQWQESLVLAVLPLDPSPVPVHNKMRIWWVSSTIGWTRIGLFAKAKTQHETTIRRLQTAQQKQMKKSR